MLVRFLFLTCALGFNLPLAPTCASDGLNVFFMWPWAGTSFVSQHHATIESVLHNHPRANVYVISGTLSDSEFVQYREDGYCVQTVGATLIDALNFINESEILSDQLVNEFAQLVAQQPSENFLLTYHLMMYALQFRYSGLYLPFDGLLLNSLEFFRPVEDPRSRDTVLEIILDNETARRSVTLDKSDFQHTIWQRSFMDRSENTTVICSTLCLRYIQASSGFAQEIVSGVVSAVLSEDERLDFNSVATLATKQHIGDVLVLPYWAMAEPKLPDHWKNHGSEDGPLSRDIDIYNWRLMHERQDWWLVQSAKLWLPISQGSGFQFNAVEKSVYSLARIHFGLGLAPSTFRPILVGPVGLGGAGVGNETVYRLTTPLDQVRSLLAPEQHRIKEWRPREAGLSGFVGGYRTFRFVRVKRQGVGSFGLVRLRVYAASEAGLEFFCRPGSGPQPSLVAGAQDSTSKACVAGLGKGKEFSVCGSPAEVNAAVHQLAFKATGETKEARFEDIHFELTETKKCSKNSAVPGLSFAAAAERMVDKTNISALVVNAGRATTVIAHSAERCELHERLAKSFQQWYPEVKISVTCECEEDEVCNEPRVDESKREIPGYTEFKVPYDYGLSRAKSFLIKQSTTPYTLVLDDDFVLTYHSCLECMVQKLVSVYHQPLPLDIVGFPVLEDERAFGAFRGTIRITDHKFFLEPIVHAQLVNGCVRVDICPMVFMANTERLKLMEWKADLPVGEHEYFFYTNKKQGLQVGVCFDSSFPHFRVNVTSPSYAKRRERMRELMSSAFAKYGIGTTYYLFHKYDHTNAADFEELISKGLDPYGVRDDAGAWKPAVSSGFKLMMVFILSGTSNASAEYRKLLRSSQSYLGRLNGVGASNYLFAVPAHGRGNPEIVKEAEKYGDIVWVPVAKQADGSDAFDSSSAKWAFEFLRPHLFMWFVVVDEAVYIDVGRFFEFMGSIEPSVMKLFADLDTQGTVSQGFVGLSRDLFHLLAKPDVSRYLSSHESIFAALDAWTRGFAAERVPVPNAAVGKGANRCVPGGVMWSPVEPAVMDTLWSLASMGEDGCSKL